MDETYANGKSKDHEPTDAERADSGLTVREDAKLLERAVRNGWVKGSQRFPTRKSRRELIQEIRERGDMTLIDRTMLTAHALLESKNERAQASIIKAVTSMERQNQVDDLAAIASALDPSLPEGTTLTPDQYVIAMDASFPFEAEAS